MLEYEKFQELQAKSQHMQEDYDHQLVEMEEKRETALQELTVYYENKLQDLNAKLEQVSSSVSSKLKQLQFNICYAYKFTLYLFAITNINLFDNIIGV